MPLRKESKRGLVALAILCAAALVTFALTSARSSAVSWGARRGHPKDAVAERLVPAR